MAAWDPVSPNIVKLIPSQNHAPVGQTPGYFVTSANSETLNDDKGAVRLDYNSKFGQVFGYYHLDPWTNALPYAGGSLPGFPGISNGKAQIYVVGLTNQFGSTAVNVLNGSLTINTNIQETHRRGRARRLHRWDSRLRPTWASSVWHRGTSVRRHSISITIRWARRIPSSPSTTTCVRSGRLLESVMGAHTFKVRRGLPL